MYLIFVAFALRSHTTHRLDESEHVTVYTAEVHEHSVCKSGGWRFECTHINPKLCLKSGVHYGSQEQPWIFPLFYALLSRDNDLLSCYLDISFLVITDYLLTYQ